jgi:hypothetical protein
MVVFWKEVLSEYFAHVTQRVALRKNEIIKAFTLHSRRPAGLAAIMVRIEGLMLSERTDKEREFRIARASTEWLVLSVSQRRFGGIIHLED